MVGVRSYIHRFGTVAIFATLFAAIHVNCEKGCVVDFENTSEFDLECKGEKSSWDLNNTNNKTMLALAQGKEGCMKIKIPVNLNSTCPVGLKFYQGTDKEGIGEITVRLIPKEGSCPDEECVWNVRQYKPGDWVNAEHKFPLTSEKEYYISLQVKNTEGKFFLDHFFLPTVDSEACLELSGKDNRINSPDPLVGAAGNESKPVNDCNLVELSKNLMLTSASVLTLNNLFN